MSEAEEILQLVNGQLRTALLVSAFDLHRQTIPMACSLLGHPSQEEALFPPLVVVDSGGYETQSQWESGFVPLAEPVPRKYEYDDYLAVTRRLQPRSGLLVVSYDGPDVPAGPYEQQIRRALDLDTSDIARDVLLKPPAGGTHAWKDLAPAAAGLRSATVVGVTVPELGLTLADRLMTLAQLRTVLDEAGVMAPIHVFGSLDPLLTPLYFAFGGELFDGLSWSRYAFRGGLSIHVDQAALLDDQLDQDPGYLRGYRLLGNLQYLESLQERMREYATGHNSEFALFGEHSTRMRAVYEQVQERISRSGH
ncbi:hypothetical protein ABDK96_15795 [Citricoccus nitrophenolicus]|uniref:Uncharacterized protein n=1 Tax=Citricoccus nitrophenolicus TaxID=863575 RepID=A0ABV0ILV3_9MICC